MTEQMLINGMTYDDALIWIESLDCDPANHHIIDELLNQIDPSEAAYHRSDIDYWRGFAAGARNENPHAKGESMNSQEWWCGFVRCSQLRQLMADDEIRI